MRMFTILTTAAAIVAPTLVMVSSDEAWDEFRTDVRDACRALVDAPEGADVAIEVNPFGSESYGAALVTVAYETGTDRMICIYDKRDKSAQMTAPFHPGNAAP
ncbi:hypothetical protein [Paracoccus sp. (in: a-proteobacteria)]|uniref:hypothetical protein n=1 Tax=Paracoccus sp. TaxID=267 RepID=UPI004057DC3C